MKVEVITRHAVSNYGSFFQALATQQILESLGHSCEIIDYIRKDESTLFHELTLSRRKTFWNKNPLNRMLYLGIRIPESIIAGRRFSAARKRFLHLSPRYATLDALRRNPPQADVFMTGSDQVWGPVADGSYDETYLLAFTRPQDKRIAYAASFGHTEMTDTLRAFFTTHLRRYDHVAVRETSAVELLNEMDIPSRQVLDPTLLLEPAAWKPHQKPIRRGKYILVYQLHNDPRLGRYARRVAKHLGLPLLRISASLHQFSREGRFVFNPSVGEFLSYVDQAECLITDSFHGTAFAITFNTPFVEILPNNKTGTRNLSILELTGLTGRILRDDDDLDLASRPIDFASVNAILAQEREKSLSILEDMLKP